MVGACFSGGDGAEVSPSPSDMTNAEAIVVSTKVRTPEMS